MHWFGKFVLIPLNLIVGVLFAYFAMQDYFGEKGKGNGRQGITAAGLKFVLLLRGLPLGDEPGDPESLTSDPEAEIPFRVEMAGGYTTTTVGKKLLDSYFAAIGDAGPLAGVGAAVPNQLAEVRRVKARIEELLNAPDAPRVEILAGLLLLQAETYDRRAEYLDLIQAGNADELKKHLDARFAAVLEGPKPVSSDATTRLSEDEADDPDKQKAKLQAVASSRQAVLNDSERRARIAHLLVHLSPEAAWQKRVLAVVGMHQYAAAIAAQSQRFRDMTARVERLILADQGSKIVIGKDTVVGGYVGQEAELQRQAINNTELANRQADLKRKWTDQKRRDDDFVSQRTTQLDAIKAQLAKVRAEVAELLHRQSAIETVLFEVQREVAVTLEEIYRLEERLAARERELLRLPPLPPPPPPPGPGTRN